MVAAAGNFMLYTAVKYKFDSSFIIIRKTM